MGVLFNLGAWLVIVALTVVPVSCQVDCPMFNETDLGTTDTSSATGLIGTAFQAVSGDPSLPVSVQVHDSNIVCLRSGQTRDHVQWGVGSRELHLHWCPVRVQWKPHSLPVRV